MTENGEEATRLEIALRVVLGYVVLGFLYTATHVELIVELENALSAQFTVFADYAALAVMVGLWPLLLVTALICGVSGCGLI